MITFNIPEETTSGVSKHFFYSMSPTCWKCGKLWIGPHWLDPSYDSNAIPEEQRVKDMKVCEADEKDFWRDRYGLTLGQPTKIPKIGEIFYRNFSDGDLDLMNSRTLEKLNSPNPYSLEVKVVGFDKGNGNVSYEDETKIVKQLQIHQFVWYFHRVKRNK